MRSPAAVHLQSVVGQTDNQPDTGVLQALLPMKFLYVASERQAAEMAGLALRAVGSDVAVFWAAGLGQARRWIDENHNVTALIVEIESDSRTLEALINHARSNGVRVPVVAVPLIASRDLLSVLGAVADEVVPRNAALLEELPHAVRRTLSRRGAPVQQVQQIALPADDQRLQRQLRDSEAAVARAEQRADEALTQLRAREESWQQVIAQEREGRAREAAAFAEDLGRRDKELADATSARKTLEKKLTQALSELEQIRHDDPALQRQLRDSAAAAARAEQEAQQALTELRAREESWQQAIEQERADRARDAAAFATDLSRRDKDLADATTVRSALEEKVTQALSQLEQVRHDDPALQRQLRDSKAAAARAEQRAEEALNQLRAREESLQQVIEQERADRVREAATLAKDLGRRDRELAEATTVREALEEKVTQALSELEQIRHDRSMAAAEEVEESRRDAASLAQELVEAKRILRLADELHATTKSDAEARIRSIQEQTDARLAEAASAADALQRELADKVGALRSLEQTARTQQTALERRLADEEAARQDLQVRLAAAADAGRRREEQHSSALAAARAALVAAEQRATKQQTDAAATAQSLGTRLAESVANADRLRAQLSETQLALTNAEQQAAADKQVAAEAAVTQQATFDSKLAHEVARHQALASNLAERERAHQTAIHALETARQDLDARLAAGDQARRQLEEQHASASEAARVALEAAEQRGRKEQTEAAAATQRLEIKLAESVANADRLRAELSQSTQALTNAEQQAVKDRKAFAVSRQDFEGRLAAADNARRQLEAQHASAIAAAQAALATVEQRAQKQQSDAAAAATALESKLAESVTNADRVRAQLSETARALKNAEQQAIKERKALDARAHDLETQLAAAADERRQVEEQHATSMEVARAALEAVERRAHKQQAEAAEAAHALNTELAKSVANADLLRAELSDTAAALTHAQQQAATHRQAAAEETKRRQAEFETLLGREVADRQALELRLAEHQQQAEARLKEAAEQLASYQEKSESRFAEIQQQHSTAIASAQAMLVEQRQKAEAALAENRERADARLAEAMANAAATLEGSLQKAAAERQSAATRFAEQQAALETALAQEVSRREAADTARAMQQKEFEASLAREVANTQTVVEQLAEAEARAANYESQLTETQQKHASSIAAAEALLVEQQRNAEAELADHRQRAERRIAELQQEADDRLAEAMANAAATLEASLQQARAERRAAAEQAAERQAQFDSELAQEEARRQTVAAKLSEAETRHAELTATLETLEIKLADTTAALERAVNQAADDRRAAAKMAATQQAEFEASLARETANTQKVVKQFAEHRRSAEAELAETRQRAEQQTAALQRQADARFAEAMANASATLEASLQHASAERQAAADQFAEQQAALETELALTRQEFARAQQSIAAGQAQIDQLQAANADGHAKLTTLEQTFEHAKATAQRSLEVLSRDHASEREQLRALVAERDGQLREQATRHQVANEAAAKAMADVEHRLGTALAAGQRDTQTIAQLKEQIAALGKDLGALKSQRDALKREADRVPVLQQVIDDTRAEHGRRFDHTPVGMWRSRPDGAIVQVNQALVSLLRYKTVDQLLDVDFSTTVFESPDELQWLVDRCLASRTTETVETTWRRKDGVGLVVRLMAIATSPETVDFVAMDITMLRTLEEKLRNSQRMEAVARYASEVAVTCNKLLGQVHQQGQQWLTRIESDSARHQGELVLDDLTRAAGFLDKLMLYGKEQKKTPELVEVKQVLRDLEPVLRRVAGSQVELVMPKTSSPYNLDVEMERFERILVNVAAYARERMPFGGRLRIDVSPVVIDRNFVEKHPNVRPGAHVLLTMTEEKGASGPDWSMTVRNQASGGNGSAPTTQTPGVDLGALQSLVSDCGGHLWILAEPSGNMELRIHLPRRVLDDRAPATKAGRGGWIGKLANGRKREAV